MASNFVSVLFVGLLGAGALMCSASASDLTDAEIRHVFGTTREDAPAYAILEVEFPEPHLRKRRAAGHSFPVKFTVDGKSETIYLEATEGILANADLPVWNAKGKKYGDDKVTYTRDTTAMSKLGDFTMYHNKSKSAAFVWYASDNTFEGGIAYHTITQKVPEGTRPNSPIRKYVLIPDKAYKVAPSGAPGGKEDPSEFAGTRANGVPDVVYPQMMITVDWNYTVHNNIAATVRKVITEMNRVDMIFRGVHEPEIRLSLSAVIVPLNDKTTPWTYKDDPDGNGVIWYEGGMDDVGLHFEPYTKEFPDDDWDLVMAFSSEALGDKGSKDGTIGGFTFFNVSCDRRWRKWRASLMAITVSSYVAVAHEIGHFFSGNHDEDEGCGNPTGVMAIFDAQEDHNLQWTECSLRNFKAYFTEKKSICYDNLPYTLIVPDDIGAFSLDEVCKQVGGTAPATKVECNGLLSCKVEGKDDVVVYTPDGTKCDDNDDDRVCYNGQCLKKKQT